MEDLLNFKETLNQKGILISFNGSFSNSIIEEIGRAIRTYLQEEKLSGGIISDVFSVYIEQTQNIRNYIELNDMVNTTTGEAVVIIAKKDGYYTISSGNSIKKDDAKELADYLEKLNSLDKKELRIMYKEQLKKPAQPESRSAGLGLIEITRKASEKIQYQFQNQNESFDFFNLFVTVKGGE
ncbi:MAG TPA: SiaB family protein kinase [Thermotogota bacterium]|nr:SiaB family protein kinase [Thermotogota bacterium]HRW34862.1 SiaB family protein kinase [Thermotogota bacterium]